MKVTITELSPPLKTRVETAIAARYNYPETVLDLSTPEFIPDPNDPEAELMVPREDRQMPNPMTKWEFVEKILENLLIETTAGYERSIAEEAGKIAEEKTKTDFNLNRS